MLRKLYILVSLVTIGVLLLVSLHLYIVIQKLKNFKEIKQQPVEVMNTHNIEEC